MSDAIVLDGDGGTIRVSGGVLDRLVREAAEEVDGVAVRRRGASVGRERVSVELVVRYGEVLPAVAEAVQRRVFETMRTVCELEPEVDVVVESLE